MPDTDKYQSDLLKQKIPIVDIYGKVDPDMYHHIRDCLMALRARGAPDIEVFISSPGGRVDVGLDIYDLFRLYPGKKSALVSNTAASMGALILQGCDVRRCAQHATILIHHITTNNVSLDELRNEKKLGERMSHMERDQGRLYKILSERSGQTVPAIRKECAKDRHMTAEEALEFGLIDEIV